MIMAHTYQAMPSTLLPGLLLEFELMFGGGGPTTSTNEKFCRNVTPTKPFDDCFWWILQMAEGEISRCGPHHWVLNINLWSQQA